MGYVNTEPVYTLLAPEKENIQEILLNFRIIPVQIRLFLGKRMQVVPSVPARLPRRSAEIAQPVRRRLFSVFSPPDMEDIAVPFLRTRRRMQCLGKPRMLVRSMVGHDIDDDAYSPVVRARNEIGELPQRPEPWVHATIVSNVIPTIRKR